MAEIGEPVRRVVVIPLKPGNDIPATPEGPPVRHPLPEKQPAAVPAKPELEPVR